MIDLATAIRAMQGIGSVALQLPAVKSLVDTAIEQLTGDGEQETAKDVYHDLIADNADGHARVQEKLAEAAKR
jgi:polyhydroxyalkanoate synthesis regulator phasin